MYKRIKTKIYYSKVQYPLLISMITGRLLPFVCVCEHIIVVAAQLIIFYEKGGSTQPGARSGEVCVAFVTDQSESKPFLLNNFMPK